MLSVVIPTYNEIRTLRPLVEATKEALAGMRHEVIIVDDRSPDGTGTLAESLKKRYRNVRVIHRSGKLGLASAILEGAALASGDLVATLNADFQHPPRLLHDFVHLAGAFDIMIASRYVPQSNMKYRNILRHVVSKVAIRLMHLCLPKVSGVKDPLSGFFAFRKSVIRTVSVNRHSSKCLMHILVNGSYKNLIEIPYTFEKRRYGRSKVSLKDCLIFLKDVTILSGKRLVGSS